MAPQPSNSRAVANTTNLLLSAKSTRARIIVFCSRARTLALQSLSQYVVQYQRVRDYLLAWLDPGLDFFETHVVRQEVSTHHLHATKLLAGRGNEHKIAIVHVPPRDETSCRARERTQNRDRACAGQRMPGQWCASPWSDRGKWPSRTFPVA